MSDVMLHGVLCMPPELWQDTEMDKRQRYSRYLQASRRIEDDEREIDRLRAAIQQTLDENGHLADGDICTLIMLKRVLEVPNAK